MTGVNSAPTQHFQYLDGWRGLAIAFLLIGHFFPVDGISLGSFGVSLFFVLSGLLMARLLFEKTVPLDVFFRRRVARVFPVALVFITAMVIGYLIAGRRIDWLDVAAAATFTNNYIESGTGPWRMPLGHLWSLSVEEHSYILLGLIAMAARRQLANPRVMVICATVVFALFGIYYQLVSDGAELFRLNLHTEVAAYGLFASAAIVLCLSGRKIPQVRGWVFVLLFGFSLATHWWSVPGSVRTIAGVGALALAVNLLAGAPKWLHAVLSIRPLRQLGVWSFSLYVWQQPFYMYYHNYGMSLPVALALAFACALASFYLIEQPCRNWLNERWGRKPAAPAEETPPEAQIAEEKQESRRNRRA